LQIQSPQKYKLINEAMLNNGNPNAILKQMIGNATPEQKQGLLSEAKKYGVPDNVLSKIQNMK